MHELTYRLYVWGVRWWLAHAHDNVSQNRWGDRVPAMTDRWRYFWQRKINALGYTVYGDRIVRE